METVDVFIISLIYTFKKNVSGIEEYAGIQRGYIFSEGNIPKRGYVDHSLYYSIALSRCGI